MAWVTFCGIKAEGEPKTSAKPSLCLDWLDQNKEPGYPGHCWGNHFDLRPAAGA